MHLPRTRALLPLVDWRERVGSTNAALRERAAAEPDLPSGALIATADQTAGRGRAGRGWELPPGKAVAASILIRDAAGLGIGAGWLPLIAGSAVAHALQPYFTAADDDADREPRRVVVKWPNDVHVRTVDDAQADRPGLKLCGILCELLPNGSVIVGTGINLLLAPEELPTERAASLLSAGAHVDGARLVAVDDAAGAALVDHVLADTEEELLRLVRLATEDPDAVRARILRDSATIGAEVRVHLPGDRVVDGRARALADDGALVVDLPTGGRLTVNAGDVEHLR
ncbi:biotin--[acetyl-CoA-carboxylase] ligase [Leucobacter tardus]|uniref:biotin--[biotin carboxyl-carrier protein] ligase n=1 Tax=Leucobacter tardus TaxID=501483 RepID=A0A939QMT5_9MICO|nr:biotin--[acetyl-CoA-carboxylase] ligase [Leucobacter tardus]MBO2990801.1 biotin--[acetyl-CoA-carboxylase] ligase [Leucobacter tardus]